MAGQTVVIAFFFLFGLIVGSFLNVCITRIPEDVSIVSPGSHCPRCQTPIKPYDNVPVLGWLWLRGKCRACGLPISPMYPLIELATGLLFVAAFVPPNNGFASVLAGRLLQVRVPGFLAGILDGILGAAFGSFLLWGLAAGYKAVRGHEGMGMGDVKMMAMIGAFLGLRGTFLTLLVGSLLGSLIGVALILALYLGGWRSGVAKRASRRGLGTERQLRWAIARQYQLPLGTFLGIGALAIVYGGPLVAQQWPIFSGIVG